MSVNKNKLYWMHSFISLALMFGFGFLPPIEPITAMGMKVLGAFLGLLYGWMFIELPESGRQGDHGFLLRCFCLPLMLWVQR